jgi:hypothetical protein
MHARIAPLAGRNRRLPKRVALATSLAALLLAAGVSPARAAVTIGSNLAREPDVSSDYSPRPTFSNVSLASDRQAPGGLFSPVNGTVVRWRIRAGDLTGATNFRIIRSLGGGLFTAGGTSASVTPPIHATTSYDVELPIQIGDYIGLDCCLDPGSAEFFVSGGAAIRNEWQPSLADGGPGRASSNTHPYEVALSAEIKPSSSFTLAVSTRNKKKGTATLLATVPNAGKLTGAGKGIKVANAAVASKTIGGPGSVQLLIKAKGEKKAELNSTGRVTLKPKITYTPNGGSPRTESKKVRLIKH